MSARAQFNLWTTLVSLVIAGSVHAAAPTPKTLSLRPKELLHYYLTFSDDSKTLLAVSQTWQEDTKNYKYALVLYDAASGKEERRLPLLGTTPPNRVTISPDGRLSVTKAAKQALAQPAVEEKTNRRPE